MAGNFRVYFKYDSNESEYQQWFDLDCPNVSTPEILNATLDKVSGAHGVEILRVIPLGVNGKPALCDELKIVDRSGRCYGALVQKVGYKEWFYYYNLGEIYSRTGTKITGNKFEILGVHGCYYENKDQVFPAEAIIDWERLSVKCIGEEFYLEPFTP